MLSVDSKFLQRSYASYSFPDFSDPGVKQKKALLYVMDKEVTKGNNLSLEGGKRDKRHYRTVHNVPSTLHRVPKEKQPLGGSR